MFAALISRMETLSYAYRLNHNLNRSNNLLPSPNGFLSGIWPVYHFVASYCESNQGTATRRNRADSHHLRHAISAITNRNAGGVARCWSCCDATHNFWTDFSNQELRSSIWNSPHCSGYVSGQGCCPKIHTASAFTAIV